MFCHFCFPFFISGGVSISTPAIDDDDKGGRFHFDVCGQLTNETLLIEGGILNIHANGFEDHKYDPRRNHSRILANYRAESENITTIIGKTQHYSNLYNNRAIARVGISSVDACHLLEYRRTDDVTGWCDSHE